MSAGGAPRASVRVSRHTKLRVDSAFEELPHGQVVRAVATVEDGALHGNGLGDVLGRLRLAGGPRGLRGGVWRRMVWRALIMVREHLSVSGSTTRWNELPRCS